MNSNRIHRIHASGDAFQIGYTLGQASAVAIRERVFATEEFKALNKRWCGGDYVKTLEAAARTHFPRYVTEIEGLAAGSEQDFDTLFMWNCRGDLRLPDTVSVQTANGAASGCTTILVPATNGRPAVIAHNEDGAPQFLDHCLWIQVEPREGLAYQSFMYPGMLPGHTLGVNAAGLVQTINNIRVHDLQPGIPRQIITRAILDCSDVDEAIAVLRRMDRAGGFHHNLGQTQSQRLLSVEAPASGCHVLEATRPIAHANHLLADPFRCLEQSITESSQLRQQRAEEMLEYKDYTDSAQVEEILFDTRAPIYRANDTGDDYSQTLATGVFEIHREHVAWRIHASPVEHSILSGVMDGRLSSNIT